MTDLEKFLALYAGFGIELQAEPIETDPEKREPIEWEKAVWVVYLHRGDHEKFQGYAAFYSAIFFDAAGNFLLQGFWE